MPAQKKPPGRKRPVPKVLHALAIIDVGSNSVRMAIYDIRKSNIVLIEEYKQTCCLAKNMTENRPKLYPTGMTKALTALRNFRTILEKYPAIEVHAVATAAMRRVEHTIAGKNFHLKADKALGHHIHVIPGTTEAKLTALGVLSSWPKATGLCCDLGGGSLELISVKRGKIIKAVSLPFGMLTLLAESNYDLSIASDLLRRRLRRLKWLTAVHPTLYPIGGSWRAVGRVLKRFNGASTVLMHGYTIDGDEARPELARISEMNPQNFTWMQKKIAARARSIPIAALVLRELLALVKPKQITFSAYGIREGLLQTVCQND